MQYNNLPLIDTTALIHYRLRSSLLSLQAVKIHTVPNYVKKWKERKKRNHSIQQCSTLPAEHSWYFFQLRNSNL